MKEELEKKLVEKYPKLYGDYKGDPTKTCMAWGFECGDGWYNLIDELSAKLEPHGVVAMQVKEKFGELRFYISEVPDDCMEDIYKHITEAEIKSLTTCEICGNEENASIRGERWLRTMCDECDKK